MPDLVPASRESIEAFLAERGATRVRMGESGIFDETGGYRSDPLTGRSPQFLARQRRARKHPLPSEYAELIREGWSAARIARRLQVPEARVVEMARELGLLLQPARPPRPPRGTSGDGRQVRRATSEEPRGGRAGGLVSSRSDAARMESAARAAYRACHAAGMSTGSVASVMGVTSRHVRRMLRVLGLEPNLDSFERFQQ